ncbi:MAG: hypothetical protein S4CHLAM102_10910 [Chlamydiia bacterium]|nr:hypothetical protein [Chlamydiia bacterium]
MSQQIAATQFSRLSTLKNALVVGFLLSVLLSLAKPFSIPLPFVPVPISLQGSLITLFIAILPGSISMTAIGCFIVQGLMGLPVFGSGAMGPAAFFGPTGGYIIGWFIAAMAMHQLQTRTGAFSQSLANLSLAQIFTRMAFATLIVYAFGALWLSQFVGGLLNALRLGVLPFILGDVIKAAALTAAVRGLRPLSRKS